MSVGGAPRSSSRGGASCPSIKHGLGDVHDLERRFEGRGREHVHLNVAAGTAVVD